MRVVRAVLVEHRHHRVDGARGFEHLLVVPVEDDLRALRAQLGVRVLHVVLLVRVLAQVEQHLAVEQVEAVVVGADIEPVAEARGALADVRHLREHEAIAPGGLAVRDRLRKALAVPVFPRFHAEQLRHRRQQIEAVVEAAVRDARLAARPLEDERDMAGRIIRGRVLRIDRELAHVLAVVGGDDDRRVVVDALRAQQVEHFADERVRVADAAVVAVHDALEARHIRGAARHARVFRACRVAVHCELVDAVRAGRLLVLLEHVLVDPGIHRLVFKRVAETLRRAVRRVRVPEMYVQEPVVAPLVAAQPVERDRQDLLAGLAAAAADVVALVEARVEPPGGMALREGADGRRVHAGAAENAVEAVVVDDIGEVARGTGEPAVCRRAAVAHRAVADAEHAADERRARRQAGRVRAVILVEADALGADAVHVRGRVAAVAVAAHMVGPQRIDVDKQDSHGFLSSVCFSLSFTVPAESGAARKAERTRHAVTRGTSAFCRIQRRGFAGRIFFIRA